MIQGSEWRLARVGSLGASSLHSALARTKTGWGASRANLMADLICERLTGLPTASYTNAAMQHGVDTEPQARDAYAFFTDNTVEQVGLVRHPTIEWSHASPDGLVGSDGILEIKCPQSATHIEFLLKGVIEDKYIKQVQWQMCCTGRQWADFVSFDPRLPAELQIKIQRVHRDDKLIAELEDEVRVFLLEIESKLSQLRKLSEAA